MCVNVWVCAFKVCLYVYIYLATAFFWCFHHIITVASIILSSSAKISQEQDGRSIYVIMKTMCSPGYHHNGFMTTHALGNMMIVYTLLVPMNQRVLSKLSKEHSIASERIESYVCRGSFLSLSTLWFIGTNSV